MDRFVYLAPLSLPLDALLPPPLALSRLLLHPPGIAAVAAGSLAVAIPVAVAIAFSRTLALPVAVVVVLIIAPVVPTVSLTAP